MKYDYKGLNKDIEEATWAGRRTVYIQAIIDARKIVLDANEQAVGPSLEDSTWDIAFKIVLETLLLERFSQETMAESREHIQNIAKMLNEMH